MTFFKKLEARARAIDSLLCVGLDPHPEDLSARSGDAARDFCLDIVEKTREVAAAYKPNAAFFEALGPDGIRALQEVIARIPDEIPVLLDVKRGDIASTARAYADAAYNVFGADAVTLNAYMGQDAIEPFVRDADKGVFLLCKTSNPSAGDLQDLPLAGSAQRLYEAVATLAETWNTSNQVGLVVGATQIESLARVRAAAPSVWILAPGVGHQGGDLEGALNAGLREDNLGVLVPVSRGISRAEDPASAARELRDAINRARVDRETPAPGQAQLDALADALVDSGCVRFGCFTLKSGLESPIYIDLRRLISDPSLLAQVAASYAPLLSGLSFDRVAALPYAAMPIGTAVSLHGGWPMIYPRREAKSYGTKAVVEGGFEAGEQVVILDDLATTGGSKLEAIEKLEAVGLVARDVVVLIDRQSGATEAMEAAGLKLHAVFTLTDLLARWGRTGRVDEGQLEAVRDFLGGR